MERLVLSFWQFFVMANEKAEAFQLTAWQSNCSCFLCCELLLCSAPVKDLLGLIYNPKLHLLLEVKKVKSLYMYI